MNQTNKLPLALLSLRIGVFIVFLVWSFDKFLNPEHTARVFQTFYFSPKFGPMVSYVIGAVQIVITLGFLLGIQKKITYGAIFCFHAVSTFTSYRQYFTPYEGASILFFAAWPMLAACFALFLLRDEDTMWSLNRGR